MAAPQCLPLHHWPWLVVVQQLKEVAAWKALLLLLKAAQVDQEGQNSLPQVQVSPPVQP